MTDDVPGSSPAAFPPPSAPPVWTAPTAWGPPGLAPPTRSSRVARTALVAVPALLVGAGAATVITLGVVHHPATSQAAAATSPAKTARHTATVGTLTATDGSTWTVQTAKGPVTVDLGAGTAYGTKAHPTRASAFHPGEQVRISGRDEGSGVTATRVAATGGTTTTSTTS